MEYQCVYKYCLGSGSFETGPPSWYAKKGLQTPTTCPTCRTWAAGVTDQYLQCNECGNEIKFSRDTIISFHKYHGIEWESHRWSFVCRSCQNRQSNLQNHQPNSRPKPIRRPELVTNQSHGKIFVSEPVKTSSLTEAQKRWFQDFKIAPENIKHLESHTAFYENQSRNKSIFCSAYNPYMLIKEALTTKIDNGKIQHFKQFRKNQELEDRYLLEIYMGVTVGFLRGDRKKMTRYILILINSNKEIISVYPSDCDFKGKWTTPP